MNLTLANDLICSVVRLSRDLEKLRSVEPERAATAALKFTAALRSAANQLAAIDATYEPPKRMTTRRVNKQRRQWAA